MLTTAYPGIELIRILRREFPSVIPKPRSRGSTINLPHLPSSLVSTTEMLGRSISIIPIIPSCNHFDRVFTKFEKRVSFSNFHRGNIRTSPSVSETKRLECSKTKPKPNTGITWNKARRSSARLLRSRDLLLREVQQP